MADRAALAYAAAALAAVTQRLLLGFWPCDDAFIVWRYAYNLVHHGQLTFNPGNPVFGCTTLSYALALAALHWMGLSISTASVGLTLAGDISCCLLLVRLARDELGNARAALLAVALWLTQPIVALNGVGGMETSLFCALLLAFALACRRGRLGEALALLALAAATRIDGLAAAPVWLFAWLRAGRPRPCVWPTVAAAAIAVGYAALTLKAYGSLLPQSAAAKAAACPRTLTGPFVLAASYVASMSGLLSTWHWFVTPHALLVPGLLAAVARLRRLTPGAQLLTLTAVAHAGLFVASGRPCVMFFQWYYVPFLTLMLLPAMTEASRLALWLAARLRGHWLVVAVLVCAVASVALPLAAWLAPWARFAPALVARNPERLARFALTLKVNSLVVIGLGWWLLAVLRQAGRAGSKSGDGAASPLPALRRGRGWGLGTALVLSLAVLALLPLFFDWRQAATRYERREGAYLALGRWAAAHLAPSEWVGAQEIGAFGWETRGHPLYDELGLITPGALRSTRAQWTARLRPAMVIGSSSLDVPLAAGFDAVPGYAAIRAGHTVFWLREDLLPAWEAAPPAVK